MSGRAVCRETRGLDDIVGVVAATPQDVHIQTPNVVHGTKYSSSSWTSYRWI